MTVDLNALEAVLAKATQGEWRIANGDCEEIRIASSEAKSRYASGPDTVVGSSEWTYCSDSNAAAIVALHNAAPALIAEHRALLARVEVLEGALGMQNLWVSGALKCANWHWDADQREAAEESLAAAEAALEPKP